MNTISFLTLAFLGIYLGSFQRFLDEIAIDLSLSKIVMGFIIATHFAGFFLGPLIAGELSDKYGRKVIVVCSLAVFLSGLAIILVSINEMMIFAGVFLVGAGFGTTEGSITTILTDAAPDESNRIINVSQIFFGLGAAAGPFMAMALIALTHEWKIFYGISILLVAVLAVCFLRYPDYSHTATEKISGSISIILLKKRAFIMLFVSLIMYVGIEEGVAFWITSYVKEWSALAYYPSLILTIFWGSVMIGRCLVSRFSQRLLELIAGSAALIIVFLTIIVLTGNHLIILVSFLGLGLSISGMWPMLIATTRIHYPEYAGTAIGLMMSGGAIGGVAVPPIMGFIGSKANMKFALAFCILPAVVIIVVLLIIRHERNAKANQERVSP